jgi:hypothetical protein
MGWSGAATVKVAAPTSIPIAYRYRLLIAT